MKMKKSLLWMCLLITSQAFAQPCKEIVGYYPNWQWYDRSKLVNPMSIDYSKYSIINYAFFAPQPNGTINSTDSWADENLLMGQPDWNSGGYVPNTSIVSQAHLNDVKIIPSIGGWTLSNNFSSIAADPVKRQAFAQACVQLIQTYNFDGVDIDWEYPGFVDHNGTPADFQNFTLFLQEIRSAIDVYGQSVNKSMLLTAAVSAAYPKMTSVDWPNVIPLLDIINVMSYDYFGAFDPISNHNSPLFAPAQGDAQFNLDKSIDLLVNTYNVPPSKITAGVAFYGRSMKTTSTPALFASTTGQADNVTFQIDEGTPLYYNTLLNLNLFIENWDDQAKVPYLTGTNGLNTFVSYDNEESIGLKAEFIMDKGLRGAIIWEITGDYIETFAGSGLISGTPLANKLNDVFCNYIPGSQPDTSSASILEFEANNMIVYPNPFESSITIKFGQKVSGIMTLTDMLGNIIRQEEVIEESIIEMNDTATLSKGSYIMTLTGSDFKQSQLIVKQ